MQFSSIIHFWQIPWIFQDFLDPKNSMDLTEIPWILWNLPFFCDSSDLCLLDCVPIMKEFFHLFLISWLNHFKNHSKAKDRLISIGSKWEKKSRNGFKWKSDYSNKRARKCTNCKCTKICTQSFRVFDNTVTRCYSDINYWNVTQIFKACVGDAGADSVGSSGCLKTSQSNDSFTLGQSNDSFSHQMSSLTLNPNEPEIENNNVLEQNSALQNNNRPRFSLNDLNVSLISCPLYILWQFL